MSVNVEMIYDICRHCGIAFGTPTTYRNANTANLRCPNGHRALQYDGQSLISELEEKRALIDHLNKNIDNRNHTIASLRGQITRLKRKRARTGGGE